MPEVTLCPAPTRLAVAGRAPRVIDPAARAARATLRADMALVALESEALARIDRCRITDKYGRTYGSGYG